MINSILLVDDEDLFHLVFEDACSILDISLSLNWIESADRAESLFGSWKSNPGLLPECMFVDLNILGSSYDGIELIRKLREAFAFDLVAGIISSSSDHSEMERAKEAGAQFWIVKSDQIEPRLTKFKEDFQQIRSVGKIFNRYL